MIPALAHVHIEGFLNAKAQECGLELFERYRLAALHDVEFSIVLTQGSIDILHVVFQRFERYRYALAMMHEQYLREAHAMTARGGVEKVGIWLTGELPFSLRINEGSRVDRRRITLVALTGGDMVARNIGMGEGVLQTARECSLSAEDNR